MSIDTTTDTEELLDGLAPKAQLLRDAGSALGNEPLVMRGMHPTKKQLSFQF